MEDWEQIHASRGKDSQVTLLALHDKLSSFLHVFFFLRDRLTWHYLQGCFGGRRTFRVLW